MTPKLFRAWRAEHDLSQFQAGVMFGVHENTVSGWEKRGGKIPQSVADLCVLCDFATELLDRGRNAKRPTRSPPPAR